MANEDVEVVEGERVQRDVAGAIAGLNDATTQTYSSIKGADFKSRKAIAAALTSSLPVADNLGKTIALKHVIVQYVEVADKDTGEVRPAPRVLLIAEDGTTYHATSDGILTSIRNIFATLGEPDTWDEAVPVVVEEQRARSGYRFMSVKVL